MSLQTSIGIINNVNDYLKVGLMMLLKALWYDGGLKLWQE